MKSVSNFLPTLFFLLVFSMLSCFEEEIDCPEGQVYNSTINYCVVDMCLEYGESCTEGCLVSDVDKVLMCRVSQ